ncbi:hypothetical protein [Roseateles sp. LYH14W]|uniref:Secreted protein n=1 Tax=Pelomonas parva TaxID=3299032 RepID=A0ABW7FAS9_9BURK
MPTRRLLLVLALVGAGVAAVWLAWPEDEPTAVPVVAEAAALAAPAPAQAAASVAMPVAARAEQCPPVPALSPHDQAMALQRAVAMLASGSGGDAVLALLMQRPPTDDAAWAEQVRLAALRSQDAQALRWAASACATPACRRELLQERLRLEPDNAVHWLAWLDEHPAAMDEAWQGLAAARYWREQPLALGERVGRALPPALLPAQREALLQPLRDQPWAASPAPSISLANACGHYGPTHPIGAACAHAATLLLTRSDTPAAWQQGADLAQQLGRSDIPPPPVPPPVSACP